MYERKNDKVDEQMIDRSRRDVMKKISIGTAMSMLNAPGALAEIPPPRAGVISQTGWKNNANRAWGNGPIDETTRRIVKYASSFSESVLTGPVLDALNNVMLDAIASLIAGFESEPARISARLARTIHSDLKSTVVGYGVTTSPELAAFSNGCMLRHCDFNDVGPGGPHVSDIISGILAVGEALHSTGSQILAAVALGYELDGALNDADAGITDAHGWDGWYEGTATAMAAGKLMGLNEDLLANALSLALVPHVPMLVSHVGALSMWKGCHAAEAIKCAVWASFLAREGMTGPSQPFEARHGLFDHDGPFRKELRLPDNSAANPDGRFFVERVRFKSHPAAGGIPWIDVIPQIKAWTKADDIESIHIVEAFAGWQETADPPKWDPRNKETADHSQPYIIARALLDGEIYLDSFTPEKIMDPAARAIMEKITVGLNPNPKGGMIFTVHKKGDPNSRQFTPPPEPQMTRDDINKKFNRVCAFRAISDSQRERVRETWSNLRAVRDIAESMRDLAKFGRPVTL